ncbi:hypothetical protein B0T17DRAFT_123619 [Bombardia bombarda]|uniref:Uncharacterized protein n=1 Tax=Bombardia bombarda TaxID=252184 RepID=A0AA39WCE1_9PEZI|nr:hypothetical protein B0T17DRAFT_123619 [Bombardia bombarda]
MGIPACSPTACPFSPLFFCLSVLNVGNPSGPAKESAESQKVQPLPSSQCTPAFSILPFFRFQPTPVQQRESGGSEGPRSRSYKLVMIKVGPASLLQWSEARSGLHSNAGEKPARMRHVHSPYTTVKSRTYALCFRYARTHTQGSHIITLSPLSTFHFPLPTSHFPLPTPHSPLPGATPRTTQHTVQDTCLESSFRIKLQALYPTLFVSNCNPEHAAIACSNLP